jgi:hypothetical protein
MTEKCIITLAVILGCLAIAWLCNGCAGCQQDFSHLKSSFVGLNRKITLYANDGSIIRSWDTQGTVEDQGGSFRFLVNGKAITLSGTVVIEEQ